MREPPTSPASAPRPPELSQPGIDQLLELIHILRGPRGCPWDRQQTYESTRANLLEEAHEVAAAIDSGDPAAIAEELGDLLFQVAFVASLAQSQGHFDLDQAARGVTAKMVERHPHVFEPDEQQNEMTTDEIKRQWQRQKQERKRELGPTAEESVLDGIPASLPPTTAAFRMTEKAAGLGFDWPGPEGVVAKIREELLEVEQLLVLQDSGAATGVKTDERLAGEIGDLLFSVINLSRHLGWDPDSALARTNSKFRRRFKVVEAGIAPGEFPDLATMEALWQKAKTAEHESGSADSD